MPNQYSPKRPLIYVIGPSIAYLQLTQGQYAVFPREDAHLVDGRTWYAWWNSHSKDYWAISSKMVSGVKEIFRLHCVIARTHGTNMTADHVQPGTGLICLPHNLRPATYSQQNMNQRRRKDNISGFKGVSKCGNRYRVRIQMGGVNKVLGFTDTAAEGAELYRAAALEMFGEFARTE